MKVALVSVSFLFFHDKPCFNFFQVPFLGHLNVMLDTLERFKHDDRVKEVCLFILTFDWFPLSKVSSQCDINK